MRNLFVGWLLGLFVVVGTASAQPRNSSSSSSSSGSKSPDIPSMVAGKTLAEWKLELAHPYDASKRALAIMAILEFGDANKECVPLIISRTQDADISPRCKAIMALRYMAIDDKDVDKVVLALANRVDPYKEAQAAVRYEAGLTLRRFLEDAGPAIPALIRGSTEKGSWEIRHLCIANLWQIAAKSKNGPDPRIVDALLVSARYEKTYQAQLEAIQGLGAMGRPGNPQQLSKVISELNILARPTVHTPLSKRPICIWAFAGLVAMQDGDAAESALRSICKYLKHENLELRAQAVQALGALGKRAKNKVPEVVTMLEDKEVVAVQAACAALVSLGDNSSTVVKPLLELLGHKEPRRAAAAVSALVGLRVDTNQVINAMEKMREDKDLDIRLRDLIEKGIKELKKKPSDTKS